MPQEQTKHEARNYHRTQMKRELIIQKLREQGCRITRQRRILLDIILEEECSCCKEIYYKALQKDSSIGPATVYRMVNTLESIGAISRKNFLQDCLWRRMLQRSGLYRRTERSYHLPLKRRDVDGRDEIRTEGKGLYSESGY